MKKMDMSTYGDIEKWIFRNSRQLEISLWKYFFKGGLQEEVLNVLSLYQNDDGGFGHGLEPDNWNLSSSPSTTLFALNILKSIGYFDISHKLYQGIIEYLSSGKDMMEYGWRFNVPSNDDFPHAPWWNYNEDANRIESVGITAEFCAFILEYLDSKTEVYQVALKFATRLIDKMMNDNEHGDMGVGGYIELVEVITKLQLKGFNYNSIGKRLNLLVTDGIEHDINKWQYYGYRPSNYIQTPKSPYYEANRNIVDIELEYLIDTKPKRDVWPITWTWFDNNARYPKEFAVSEVWWKGIKALEKMKYLREFDRLSL